MRLCHRLIEGILLSLYLAYLLNITTNNVNLMNKSHEPCRRTARDHCNNVQLITVTTASEQAVQRAAATICPAPLLPVGAEAPRAAEQTAT